MHKGRVNAVDLCRKKGRKEDGSLSMQKGRRMAARVCRKEGGRQLDNAERKEEGSWSKQKGRGNWEGSWRMQK